VWLGAEIWGVNEDGSFMASPRLLPADDMAIFHRHQEAMGLELSATFEDSSISYPEGHRAHGHGKVGINNASLVYRSLLAFTHAKGTTFRDVRAPAKLQQSRRRKGRPFKIQHKVLVIGDGKPMSGGAQGGGVEGKALHIARGSFATYSAEKPLFGHYVGTVWRPMHVRGSRDYGEVQKQYKVEPGKGGASQSTL
jgi:hypothetical protein